MSIGWSWFPSLLFPVLDCIPGLCGLCGSCVWYAGGGVSAEIFTKYLICYLHIFKYILNIHFVWTSLTKIKEVNNRTGIKWEQFKKRAMNKHFWKPHYLMTRWQISHNHLKNTLFVHLILVERSWIPSWYSEINAKIWFPSFCILR